MPDDDLGELARALRQGAGHEMRAEAEENENLTEVQRRRRQDLADVARAAMHRGDRLTLTVADLHLAHPVVSVGADYLVMESGDEVVDVRLDAAVINVEPRTAGGRSSHPESATFRARLAEHEYLADVTEVVTIGGRRVAGRIEVTATDHVVVTDDTGVATFVPITAVAVVVSRRPPMRS